MKNLMIPRAIMQKLMAMIVIENLGGKISSRIIRKTPKPINNPDTTFPPCWLAQVYRLYICDFPLSVRASMFASPDFHYR
jgi:hypothetical protein